MSLNLRVLTSDEDMSLYSRYFSTESTFSASYQCPSFTIVGAGTEWTLAWTIESIKGKKERVHVVDAVELASGTCQ
jgi:hypothetical protein